TLQEEAELEQIVRLVGADALPPEQQLTLEAARMIREIFLQQNAYHAVDTFCPPERQFKLISAIKKYADLGKKSLALDVPVKDIAGVQSRALLTRSKYAARPANCARAPSRGPANRRTVGPRSSPSNAWRIQGPPAIPPPAHVARS